MDADIIHHAANKSFPLEYESIFITKWKNVLQFISTSN